MVRFQGVAFHRQVPEGHLPLQSEVRQRHPALQHTAFERGRNQEAVPQGAECPGGGERGNNREPAGVD